LLKEPEKKRRNYNKKWLVTCETIIALFAYRRVSGNHMTTDRATAHRQKNDPKSQPHKMAHLVLPDTQANASQNQKSHFLPPHRQTKIVTCD
jgi:hypothetical protein